MPITGGAPGVTKHTDLTDKEVGGILDHADASVTTDKLAANAVSQSDVGERTSGNVTTTSTSFVDVDATNLAVTLTTTGGDVLVMVQAVIGISASGANVYLDIDLDGTREGGTDGLAGKRAQINNDWGNASFSFVKTGLSAASHTFKLQMRVSAATGTLYASSGWPCRVAVVELKK